MVKGIKVESGGRTLNPLDNKRQRMVAVIGNKVAENIFKKGENLLAKNFTRAGSFSSWSYKI